MKQRILICFENGEDFLAHFRAWCLYAVFMDIILDRTGLNGIETAKSCAASQNGFLLFLSPRNVITL